MVYVTCIVFRAHKNFYRPEFSKSEVEELKTNITFFAAEFPKIDHVQVGKALEPYAEGKLATTRDLEFIVFTKCNLKEKIGDQSYVAKFVAK